MRDFLTRSRRFKQAGTPETRGIPARRRGSQNHEQGNSPARRGGGAHGGAEFQPPFPQAFDLMTEIMSGLVQFCLQCLCAPNALAAGADLAEMVRDLRDLRDRELLMSPSGRQWVRLLEE